MRSITVHKILLCGMALAWVSACSSTKDEKQDSSGDDAGMQTDSTPSKPTKQCPVIVSDSDCDESLPPFVFVHGTYGSGDNFAHVAMLLGSNGYCQERIVGVEYNSIGGNPASDGSIDAKVNEMLDKYPEFDQVILAGHSQGTGHCGSYLAVPEQAAKISHYINYSGSPATNDVHTLSLSSEKDLQDTPHHATGNDVKTVTFKDEDHFAVAASRNAFIETYKFIVGKDPKYKEVQCGDETVTVEGIAETFGDNARTQGTIEIRKMTDTPRDAQDPVMMIGNSGDGHFGPIELERGVSYEFKGFDETGALIGYQYFTPFMRSNRLVRMLSPSKNILIAALSTNNWVKAADNSAIVVRWLGGGFREDLGGSMKVNGLEVLTSENAGEMAHANANLSGGTVGFFMSDANHNQQSDLDLYYSSSFLAFTDVFVDTSMPEFIEIKFLPGSEEPNGKATTIKVPNWPGDAGDISVTFQ